MWFSFATARCNDPVLMVPLLYYTGQNGVTPRVLDPGEWCFSNLFLFIFP